jgi:hypothetical protein
MENDRWLNSCGCNDVRRHCSFTISMNTDVEAQARYKDVMKDIYRNTQSPELSNERAMKQQLANCKTPSEHDASICTILAQLSPALTQAGDIIRNDRTLRSELTRVMHSMDTLPYPDR